GVQTCALPIYVVSFEPTPSLRHRELDVLTVLRQLLIRFIEGFELPTIRSFLKRLSESERCSVDSLVDIGSCGRSLVGIETELVVGHVGICLPFQLKVLRTYLRTRVGAGYFQIALEEIAR